MQEYGMFSTLDVSLGLGFLQLTWFFSSLYLVNLYLTLFFSPLRFVSPGVFLKNAAQVQLRAANNIRFFFLGGLGVFSWLSISSYERGVVSVWFVS